MSLYNLVGYVAAGLGALTVDGATRHAGAAGAGTGSALLFWLFALSGGVWALALRAAARALVRPAAAGAPAPPPRGASSTASRPSSPSTRSRAASSSRACSFYWLHSRFALGPGRGIGAVFSAAQLPTACSLLLAAWAAPADRARGTTMVSPTRLERAARRDGARADGGGSRWRSCSLRALALADGRPDPAGVLMAGRGGRRARGGGEADQPDRTVAQAVSPALTGWVMQAVSLTAPFVLGRRAEDRLRPPALPDVPARGAGQRARARGLRRRSRR